MKVINEQNSRRTFRIGVVVSRFNEPVTSKLLEGALARLRELDFEEQDITVVWVPGAVEIPLVTQRMAQLGTFEALVCLGAVIRGETTHYDYVCEQVSQGCQHVSMQNDVPVVFGVLTTENAEQAYDRVGGKKGHKGRDAIDCAVEMVCALEHFQI